MEDPKDDKKEKQSPELKEKLTEDELKSVDGGDRNHFVMYGYSKKIKTQEPRGGKSNLLLLLPPSNSGSETQLLLWFQ